MQIKLFKFGLKFRELGCILNLYLLDLKIFVNNCQRTPNDLIRLIDSLR